MKEINLRQILIGLSVLFIGLLIYLVDRPPGQTYLVYATKLCLLSLYDKLPDFFGPIGKNLPAFIHVFSFSLITAGLLSCRKKGCAVICLTWLLVDTFFEIGQGIDRASFFETPGFFIGVPFLENFGNYFRLGTFDYLDLVFIVCGSLSAYLVIRATMKRRYSL